MPRTISENIQPKPSRRRLKARPACGSHSCNARGISPAITAGVNQPSTASASSGARPASHATALAGASRRIASASASTKGRASISSSIRVLGSCRGNRAPRGHHPILAAAIAIPGGGLADPWRMQPDPDGASPTGGAGISASSRVLGSCRGTRAPRGHHPILAAAIAIPGGGLAYPWRMQPDPAGAPRARDPSRDEAGHALLFGGSGPLGSAVLARLLAAGWRVDALSRAPREARPGLRWWRGDLGAMPALPETCDAVLSCGPLDLFAAWYAAAGPRARRGVAFGSTSATTKRTSADAGERDLAARLAGAESTLLDAAPRRGAGAVVLRPTLVYGGQAPLALERMAEMA